MLNVAANKRDVLDTLFAARRGEPISPAERILNFSENPIGLHQIIESFLDGLK